MKKVTEILNRFGTKARCAEKLGVAYTTVSTWWDNQAIPYKEWRRVADASTAAGIPLTVQEIFDAHEADRASEAA